MCYQESRRNRPSKDLKATTVSKRSVFVLITWSWPLPELWMEACGSSTDTGPGDIYLRLHTWSLYKEIYEEWSDWLIDWSANTRYDIVTYTIACN